MLLHRQGIEFRKQLSPKLGIFYSLQFILLHKTSYLSLYRIEISFEEVDCEIYSSEMALDLSSVTFQKHLTRFKFSNEEIGET